MSTRAPSDRRHLDDRRDGATLADDVLDGLTRPLKELPPKYFYDARGSELFDRITALPEYYPTRAERAILEAAADAIVAATGAAELVELGSGTAAKTRVLLDAMAGAGHAAALRAVRRRPSSGPRLRRRAGRGATRASTCTAWSATSGATSTAIPPASRPPPRRLPRRHDRQLPAGQPAALPARAAERWPGRPPVLGTDLVKDRACSRRPMTTAPG